MKIVPKFEKLVFALSRPQPFVFVLEKYVFEKPRFFLAAHRPQVPLLRKTRPLKKHVFLAMRWLQRNGCHPHDCMCFTGQNGPRAFQTPSGFIWPPGFQNVSKTSFQIAKDDLEMASKLIPEWPCFHDSITSYFHDSILPCFHLVHAYILL